MHGAFISCSYMCIVSMTIFRVCAKWTIVDPPIVFGKTAKLGCTAEEVSNATGREWTAGQNHTSIVLNGITNNPKKYEERTKVHPFQSQLLIHDFSESDVGINYTCSIGVYEDRHRLELDEHYFEYHPDIDYLSDAILLRSGIIFGEVTIPKVYPKPKCKVMFQGSDIFACTEVNAEEKGKFFTAKIVFNSATEECKGVIEISCLVGETNIRLLRENKNECQGTKTKETHVTNEKGSTRKSEEIAIITLGILLALFVLGMCICGIKNEVLGRASCNDVPEEVIENQSESIEIQDPLMHDDEIKL